jgi:hypothetical protein
MTSEGTHVIEGATWIELHPGEVALIRGGDPERRPVAAIKLSEGLWVALGDEPPATGSQVRPAGRQATTPVPATSGDGGWPPEPPPDVDSED